MQITTELDAGSAAYVLADNKISRENIIEVRVIQSARYVGSAPNAPEVSYLVKGTGEEGNEAYFGEVGKRMRNVELTYIKSTGWDGQYGYTYLHSFSGPNGERIQWKTGNDLGSLGNGDKVVATFTVKAHEEYKGTLQTKVTRMDWSAVTAPAEMAVAA